jgi:prephenate dehydratase
MKIAISGNKGSFSEEAAEFYCLKHKIANAHFEYLIGVENSLNALTQNKADKAIFPIENSNGGAVLEALYAMSNYIFKIDEIFEIDVKHNLLALPGTNVGTIKKIVSHPQALKQCRMYLKRKWENTELEEYSDTASAANDLSLGKIDKNSAVIAPKVCAVIYGLDILEENIQDLKFNYTSFIVATRK